MARSGRSTGQGPQYASTRNTKAKIVAYFS